MKTLKELEYELTLDWQNIQLLDLSLDRSKALKDYQLKHAMYRQERNWQLLLQEPEAPK